LSTSPDYQRVFKHLPKNVDSWGYLNLPKIMKLLRESAVVQGFIAAKPEAQKVFEYAKGLEKELFGAGWTSYRSEGAVLRQSCYPDVIPSFAGGATTIGIVSSIAIPNLMSSTQKEKQKRTMSDMRAIGVAVESFVVDNGMWPGPTKGYVPVEEIKAKLEPTYIRELPTKDAWGNPYLYWSNEKEYIFYSRGKDGQEDEPYGQEIGKKIQEAATSRFENDIIYSNGKFIRHPEGIQGELHVVPKK
jgi:type II secretion system protein G